MATINIPKLDLDGANWPTWKALAHAALGASMQGVARHLEGAVRKPPPLPTNADGAQGRLSDDEEAKLKRLEERWDEYSQREAIAKFLIFTSVPEVVLIEIKKLETVKEVWDALCSKFDNRSYTYKLEIRRQMSNLKCTDENQIEEHIAKMKCFQDRMCSMGGDGVSNHEFIFILLKSLPDSYEPLVRSLTLIYRHTQPEPKFVIEEILGEFYLRKVHQDRDEAELVAKTRPRRFIRDAGSSSAGESLSTPASGVECWFCHKKGHVRRECRGWLRRENQ